MTCVFLGISIQAMNNLPESRYATRSSLRHEKPSMRVIHIPKKLLSCSIHAIFLNNLTISCISLPCCRSTGTWQIEADSTELQGWRHIRIHQNGKNASGQTSYLSLSGFEIYGTVTGGCDEVGTWNISRDCDPWNIQNLSQDFD